MVEENVVQWLYEEARALLNGATRMGDMEKALDRACREVRRQALERWTQATANQQPLVCPRCKAALNVVEHRRARTVNASFGKIRFTRSYGACLVCQDQTFPADVTLGLHPRAPASPRVQEICALTTLRAPAGQAEEDVRRLTGLELGASTLHQEARRQGERALTLREADEQRTQNAHGIAELAARAHPPDAPFTLVIEIDAWNIRERDNWGKTEALVKAGKELERWHWVYTGTVFRLDQRGTTESGRPVIAERGYVATRRGLESFQHQLYAETLQRGLQQAQLVLILGDGAIWIWNLAEARFRGAMQRVDLHHVQEHLWDLAHELHGKGSVAAQTWVQRRQGGALDVIDSLKQLHQTLESLTRRQRKAIRREIGYLEDHKNRMDYKAGKALGQPVGSGAIESTCSQYQRRFKLTGQFWSLAGDEAFLALATLHRNGRWSQLFPHDAE